MVHLFIGACTMAGFFILINYTTRKKMTLPWWQWTLTLLGFLYTVFVLEIILSFIQEGVIRGALVVGLIMGFIAVVWGVLLGRFVFNHKKG